MNNEPNEAEKKLAKIISSEIYGVGYTDPETIAAILAAHRADEGELTKELKRAKGALIRSGFEDLGGQEWKPPVNHRVTELQERVNELAKALEKIEAIKCGEYSTLYLLDEARIIARAALARHAGKEATP